MAKAPARVSVERPEEQTDAELTGSVTLPTD